MIAILFRFVLVSLLFAGAAAVVAPAAAGETPTLRAHISVAKEILTLGDFFKNAGSLAEKPLFRAPDLGEIGTVEAWRVIDAARLVGLSGEDADGITEVVVERRSIRVSGKDIAKLIKGAIAEQARLPSPDSISMVFAAPPQGVDADPGAIDPIRLAGLRWSRRSGRFNAFIDIDEGRRKRRIRLNGTAHEMITIAMLSRSYSRDEIVSRDDIIMERVPRGQVGARAVLSADEIAGKAVRRDQRARQPLDPDDFTRPMLVRRGETVTIFFEIPGLTLTARGKALESGIDGDMVNVVNSQSNRIIRARIVGRGKVSVKRQRPKILKLSEAG